MQLFSKILGRPQQDSQPKLTLTEHLLNSTPEEYKAATQAPFLLAAAQGRLSKEVLGRWLANDRLYFHSYIRAAGKLLASLDLPLAMPESDNESPETSLADWIIEDLVRIRDSEKHLIGVASQYGIEIDLDTRRPIGPAEPEPGSVGVAGAGRLPGLGAIGDLFDSVASLPSAGLAAVSHPTAPTVLPWLEAAVMFWGTERCHVDAWSWAKAHQPAEGSGEAKDDADGGALRREFIPGWSSDEFKGFVARLACIIDRAVDAAVETRGKEVREEVLRRVEGKWQSLVVAERAFWPAVE
ncbi:heme oxygenase-like protein [Coniochaeta sp. PMI_546]|nr:heme oxygenase-like protein [Coniochaeta sp. PMI_546]